MAIAICEEGGGHRINWRASRGRRLADVTCPVHGTPVHGGNLGRAAAGALVPCVACGRRRRGLAGNVVYPPVAFQIPENGRKLHLLQEARVIDLAPGPHPAGSPLCAWHRWEPV